MSSRDLYCSFVIAALIFWFFVSDYPLGKPQAAYEYPYENCMFIPLARVVIVYCPDYPIDISKLPRLDHDAFAQLLEAQKSKLQEL